jgi:hypothetical protein
VPEVFCPGLIPFLRTRISKIRHLFSPNREENPQKYLGKCDLFFPGIAILGDKVASCTPGDLDLAESYECIEMFRLGIFHAELDSFRKPNQKLSSPFYNTGQRHTGLSKGEAARVQDNL